MKMSGTDADVIDALVGITPGSPLDAIRARRPEARAHAQATYRALFAPEAQATSPHRSVSRWMDRLRRSGLDDPAVADVIHAAAFFNWANRLMLSLGKPAATAGP